MGFKRAVCIELNSLSEEHELILGYLTYHSGKLWNQANYLIRNRRTRLDYRDLYNKLKDGSVHLRSLHSRSAQIVLDELVRAWKSYFSNRKNNNEDTKPPGFVNKKKPHRVVTWDKTGFRILGSKVRLSLSSGFREHLQERFGVAIRFLWLDTGMDLSGLNVLNIQIVPHKYAGVISYSLRLIHQVEGKKKKPKTNGSVMTIDFGSRNFATVVVEGVPNAWVVDGGKAKSVMRKRLKRIAKLQGRKDHLKAKKLSAAHIDRQLHREWKRLNNFLRDFAHKASWAIARLTLKYNVSVIRVGDWYQGKNEQERKKLSATVEQMVHFLPHGKMVEYLKYKLEPYGVKVKPIGEEYTSRADSLDKNAGCSKQTKGSGSRIKRGLFLTASGRLINADVNACRNMLRKHYQGQGLLWFDEITGLGKVKRVYLYQVSPNPNSGIGVEADVSRPSGIRELPGSKLPEKLHICDVG